MALNTKTKPFSLPPQIVGQTDLSRLLRELETLETQLINYAGKSTSEGSSNPPPKITSLLNQTAATNGYNLMQENDRRQITGALLKIHDHAPLLHISFAAEPSPKVTETLLDWMRSNIHRYALLQIGLQPSIAAGCVLRTPNKIFDLSLRASFERQKPYLVELIKGAVAAGK